MIWLGKSCMVWENQTIWKIKPNIWLRKSSGMKAHGGQGRPGLGTHIGARP